MPLDPDRLILMSTEDVTNWSIDNPTVLPLFDMHTIPDEPLVNLFGKRSVNSEEAVAENDIFRYHSFNRNKHVVYKSRIESAAAMRQLSMITSWSQHEDGHDRNPCSHDKVLLMGCNSSLADSLKLFRQTARKATEPDGYLSGPFKSSRGQSKLRVESRSR